MILCCKPTKPIPLFSSFIALEEPLQECGILLNDFKNFYEFKRDVEDPQLWIKEKEPILRSENLGDSLHGVQSMKKRHSSASCHFLVFLANFFQTKNILLVALNLISSHHVLS